MQKRLFKTILTIIASGFGMWVIAGLWHNLIVPAVVQQAEPHHEGIFIMLISYLVLAGFMTYIYSKFPKQKILIGGLWVGVLIGIIWTFPHGLTMAGAHGTSILYEIKNSLWHCFEQGIGGVLIALIKQDESFT